MPSSSSSNSSSSFSSSCSSSSAVVKSGELGVLAQDSNNFFVVDTGTAYDSYGRRISLEDRLYEQLTFPDDCDTEGGIKYGYLCIRKKETYKVCDYLKNPQTSLPSPSKINDKDIELYISPSIITEISEGNEFYYPVKDSNGFYDGLVLAKVWDGADTQPQMGYRTYLVVSDGTMKNLRGFPINADLSEDTSMEVLSASVYWSSSSSCSCSCSSSSDSAFSSSSSSSSSSFSSSSSSISSSSSASSSCSSSSSSSSSSSVSSSSSSFSSCSCSCSSSSGEVDWYHVNYQHRKKITVDSDDVYGTQTNFPVYVDLSDLGSEFFSAIKSDGSDILVTDWSGDTVLKREVVSLDTASEKGGLFFKAPVLYDYSDNDFYIYYEYAAGNLTNDVEVWDDDFVLSQHLEESTTDYIDSTQYGNDGTSTTGAVIRTSDAKAMYGQYFYADDGIIANSSTSLQLSDNMTFYGWVKFSDTTSNQTFLNKGLYTTNLDYLFGMYSIGPKLKFSYYDTDLRNVLESSGWSPTAHTFYHIGIIVNKSESRVTFLVNGEEKSSVVDTNNLNYSVSSDNLIVGTTSNSTNGLKGTLDEITLSKSLRSPDWIKTVYYNQNQPSSFYVVGSQEDRPDSSSSSSSSSFSSSCSCSSSFSSSSSSSSYYLEALETIYSDNTLDYVEVSTDSNYIYTTDDSNTLRAYSFDGSTLTEEDTIAVNFGSNSGGRNLISDDNYTYTRYTYDMQSAGGYIWYPTRIYAYSFDGSSLSSLANLDPGDEFYSFATDGDYIYVGVKWVDDTPFFESENHELRIYSFDGSSFTLEDTYNKYNLANNPVYVFSGDNSTIYFYSDPYLVRVQQDGFGGFYYYKTNIGSIGSFLNSYQFSASNGYAYLHDDSNDNGVVSVYYSDFNQPHLVSDTSDLIGTVTLSSNLNIFSNGNQFFISNYSIIGYELKNNSATQKFSIRDTQTHYLNSADFDSNYMYAIADNDSGNNYLQVLDCGKMNIANADLQLIDTYSALDTGEEIEFVWANYPYVFTSGTDKIRFFSFDGNGLTHIQDLNWSSSGSSRPKLWADNTYLYAVGLGVYAYKINASGLTLVASYDVEERYESVWSDSSYIYVSSTSSLKALSLNTSTQTFDVIASTASDTNNIWGHGNYLYCSQGSSGFSAYTFDGSSFTEVDAVDIVGIVKDIWSDSTYVYVATSDNYGSGIHMYTFDGSAFTYVSTYQTGNSFYGVYGGSKFNGGYGFTYTSENEGGLRAYLIGNNNKIAVVDEDYQGGNYYGIFADTQYSGFGYIYVAGGSSGLHVYKLDAEILSSSSSSFSSSSSSSDTTFSSSSSSSSFSSSSSSSCSSSSSSYSSSSSSFSSCSSSSDATFSSCSSSSSTSSSSSSSNSNFSSSSSSYSSSSFSSSSSSSANAVGADWYDSNWSYRQRITVDDTQILGSHDDFTVYLDLSVLGSSFFSNVKSDGTDIVITNKGGSAKLPREVVTIDTSEETGTVFFASQNLNSSDRDFYIYYGNASASESNDVYTWNSDYVGVWHLDEYESPYSDSGQHQNNGSGSSTRTKAPMSYGQAFFENDRIDIPNSDSLEIASGLSIGTWFNKQDDDDQIAITILTSDFEANKYNYVIAVLDRVTTGKQLVFIYRDKDSGSEVIVRDSSAWNPEINKWYYLAVIVDKDNQEVTFMVDGYVRSTVSDPLNYTTYSNCQPIIGRTDTSIEGPTQSIDELWLSKSPRSTNYYQTLYNNLGSANTFYSIGAVESNSSPSSSSSSSSSS